MPPDTPSHRHTLEGQLWPLDPCDTHYGRQCPKVACLCHDNSVQIFYRAGVQLFKGLYFVSQDKLSIDTVVTKMMAATLESKENVKYQ